MCMLPELWYARSPTQQYGPWWSYAPNVNVSMHKKNTYRLSQFVRLQEGGYSSCLVCIQARRYIQWLACLSTDSLCYMYVIVLTVLQAWCSPGSVDAYVTSKTTTLSF